MNKPFWQTKTLFEMTPNEWESICDGCAKCCLTQLQNQDTEQLVFTNVACDLLDSETCRCSDYENRSEKVPNCMTIDTENVVECAEFSPSTCSYRLMLEGKPLPSWHHLVSGDDQLIHRENQSVQGRVRYNNDVDDDELENHIVDWC